MTLTTARTRVRSAARSLRSRMWRPNPAAPRPLRQATTPNPPRKAPSSKQPLLLTPSERLARASLSIVVALAVGFLGQILVVSHLEHAVAQQQVGNEFRAQLAAGTAPVGEGTVDDVLLADGAPVAYLQIPAIGLHQYVVEGSNAGALRSGPGHRRDTVLPGQIGTSIIMGRAAAYGGPFGRIQELQPGQRFGIVTGQGVFRYQVIGVRYAGDLAPPAPVAGESRLILESARGPAYAPSGVIRVDARLTDVAQPAGVRQTTAVSLAAADRELVGDTSTVWALVFALQFFLIVEAAGVWALRRVGPRKTWVVFAPVLLLSGLLVADQAVRLLPNLL